MILPVVLFIGVTTFFRMGTSNYYDALCVVGMNRIRHAYLQITPEVEPFLVMGTYDDDKSINLSMGAQPKSNFVLDVIASTPVRGGHHQLGHRRRHRHPLAQQLGLHRADGARSSWQWVCWASSGCRLPLPSARDRRCRGCVHAEFPDPDAEGSEPTT